MARNAVDEESGLPERSGPEHLFTLRESLAAYRSYQKLIDD